MDHSRFAALSDLCRWTPRRQIIFALITIFALTFPSFVVAAPHPVVIRYRYWGDNKGILVNELLIKGFEKTHPGVIVRGEYVTSAGTEYVEKLLLEKSAGLEPDVISCNDNFAPLAGRGLLLDLRPLAAHDNSVDLRQYYPRLLQVFELGNKLYALPHDVAPTGLIYYNKSLFDKAGVPYPDGSWSWNYKPRPNLGNKDFLTVAETLTTRNGVSGQTIVYGFSSEFNDWTMDNFVYSSNADFVDNIYRPTRLLYSDPRVINAMQLTADMMYKYDVAPSSVDLLSSAVGSHELFAQGKEAMYMGGIWEAPRFRDEIKNFDWDIAPFPAGPTGSHAVDAAYSGYSISASTQHPKEAWEFLKYVCGPIGQSKLAATGISQPGLAYLADSKVWLDGKRPLHRIVTIQETPFAHYGVLFSDWTQVRAIIDPKVQLVWEGTLSAKEAVALFEGPAQRKLDELNHPPKLPRLNWTYGALALIGVALLLVLWVWQGAVTDLRSGRKIGRRSEALAGYLFVSPWIVGGVVFLAAPMLVSLLLAFCSWDMLTPATWVGVGNFNLMAQDTEFWQSLGVTGVYTLFSVPLGVAGSLALALLLHTKIRGQSIFRTLYYLPSVTSAVAASLVWMRLFNPESGFVNYILGALHLVPIFKALGLTDPTKGYVNWLGSEKTALASLVIMSLWGVGGGMVIYLAGLQGIPQSYYEAAAIDGASVWQKFRHVTLPLLTPTIYFTTIIGVIGSFQVFTQGFVMTQGGPNNATLFYVLYLYQNAFEFLKIGYASALAWVLFAIILVFTLLQIRLSSWVHYEAADTK